MLQADCMCLAKESHGTNMVQVGQFHVPLEEQGFMAAILTDAVNIVSPVYGYSEWTQQVVS